jgi:hypothetical protein
MWSAAREARSSNMELGNHGKNCLKTKTKYSSLTLISLKMFSLPPRNYLASTLRGDFKGIKEIIVYFRSENIVFKTPQEKKSS